MQDASAMALVGGCGGGGVASVVPGRGRGASGVHCGRRGEFGIL